MRFIPLAALSLLLLAGCVASDQKSQATAAASRFVTAVSDGDGSVACALLTPAARSSLESDSGKPCADAVTEIDVSPGSGRAQVWGDEALVRMGGDTLFLDHSSARWLVRGSGCTRQGEDQPYDCEVAP